ncbi:MAG: hypothetical protein KJO31_10685 [Gammaproteobacteria bacterium]|nr:hypothetical protein [Gammaproteobacteria bacterium]
MALDIDVIKHANMSQTQLQIWIAQMLRRRSPMYNMGMGIEIRADLDAELFRSAFDLVIRASDSMRSVFRYADGGPVRAVLQPAELEYEVPVLDYSGKPDDAMHWMREQMRQPFNLTNRAFDSALLRTGPESFTWFISKHHLICDGWSFANFTDWVGNKYGELEAGDDSKPQIPQYQDFVDREILYYASDACRQSAEYWDELASEPLPPLALYGRSTDNASTENTRVHRQLSGDLVELMENAVTSKHFRAFSKDQGMYLLLLSAMVVALNVASNNDRFSLAVCLHNRVTTDDKTALGTYFIHSALRAKLEAADSFAQLYRRISKDYRQVLRHYRHPVSTPPGERVWDATVNYVNKTFPDFAGRRTHVHWLRSGRCSAEELIGLQLHRFNGGDGLEAEWDFNLGMFPDAANRDQFGSDFEQAIKSGIENPDTALERLW